MMLGWNPMKNGGGAFSLDAFVTDALVGAQVVKQRATQPPTPAMVESLVGGHFSYVVTAFGEERLVSVGDEAKRLFGVADAWCDDGPERLWTHVRPTDRMAFWRALRSSSVQSRSFKCELRIETDKPRHLACRAFATRDQEQLVWHVAVQDVTRERRLEARLAELHHHETRGVFVAGMAHNFLNVLSSIMPNLEHCRAMVDSELQPALDDAIEAARTATTMVSGLFKAVRAEPDDELQPTSPVFAVHEITTLCQHAFGPEVDLRVDVKGPIYNVLAEPGELEMVLLNLCINARDAMQGTDEPRLTLRVRPSAGDKSVLIEVEDNGSGMSEEVLARIGEPFFTTKPRGRGTGLGLATAWDTVRRLGGDMTCQSCAGAGTTFTISLPRHLTSPSSDDDDAPSGIQHREPKPRVLIVDDEELVRRALKRLFLRHGVEVIEAEDARGALLAMHDGGIDLVLLDLGLPDMPGDELMAKLRRRYPNLPIVVATGFHYEDHELPDATRVMAKPLQHEHVRMLIRELIVTATSP